MAGLFLTFSAGALLDCDDCGKAMMACLDSSGQPVLAHALPVCEVFADKATAEARREAQELVRAGEKTAQNTRTGSR